MLVALLVPEQWDAAVSQLAELLVDCVDGGASVGFLAPLPTADAGHWWGQELRSASRRTWIARDDQGSIVGCVLLSLESRPNGAHRAEVRKLLVHRRARGLGVGTSLMDHVEDDARELGRTLLMLDTESGSAAEHLYRRRGWVAFGVVSDHARKPDGRLSDTTFMTKTLTPVPTARG